MARQWQSVAVAFLMLLPLNEAVANILDSGVREKTKEEIMAGMTLDDAINIVLSLNGTRKEPALVSLVERAGAKAQHGQVHQHDANQASLRGGKKNDSFKKAIDMLNNMTMTAESALDVETQRCLVLDEQMTNELTWLQDEVRRHNGMAAAARGMVIIAQGNIATITSTEKETTIKFEAHKVQCIDELNALQAELNIVLSDIKVMTQIITMIDCDEDSQANFFQDPVKIALGKLKSDTAKKIFEHLVEPNMTIMPVPVGGVNVSDVPTSPPKYSCEAPGCRIPRGGCQRLKDRFLVVNAGILDRKAELGLDISQKDQYCQETSTAYEAQISGMRTRLASEKGDLAVGTQKQNENEEGSHQKSKQHAETSKRYTKEMAACCKNKNVEKGTICALEKIRSKVDEIQGDDQGIYFVDCAVSDWTDEECSATCGGGIMRRTRSVITQPQGGGVPCPPLATLMKCNLIPCPINCEMSDWEGWSACSAECGGGVREKTRNIQRDANFGGDPCEESTAEEACNVFDCNEDCVLSEWSAWSTCSKMCGGGSQTRTRYVKVPKRGNGECWDEADIERVQYIDCNAFRCQDLLDSSRQTLVCASKVDAVLLLDGSASLGRDGWFKSVDITTKLLTAFGGVGTEARVALELFSGPSNWPDYEKCVGISRQPVTDMKKQCGIEWVGKKSFHEGSQEIIELAKTVGAFTEEDWPESTTLTSMALGECESALFNGRPDALSVAIVVTDGWPMSQKNTKAAALKLGEHVKIVWVAVGAAAPIALIEEMASAPPQDHVIKIDSFQDLETPWAVNQIISTVCPIVA